MTATSMYGYFYARHIMVRDISCLPSRKKTFAANETQSGTHVRGQLNIMTDYTSPSHTCPDTAARPKFVSTDGTQAVAGALTYSNKTYKKKLAQKSTRPPPSSPPHADKTVPADDQFVDTVATTKSANRTASIQRDKLIPPCRRVTHVYIYVNMYITCTFTMLTKHAHTPSLPPQDSRSPKKMLDVPSTCYFCCKGSRELCARACTTAPPPPPHTPRLRSPRFVAAPPTRSTARPVRGSDSSIRWGGGRIIFTSKAIFPFNPTATPSFECSTPAAYITACETRHRTTLGTTTHPRLLVLLVVLVLSQSDGTINSAIAKKQKPITRPTAKHVSTTRRAKKNNKL